MQNSDTGGSGIDTNDDSCSFSVLLCFDDPKLGESIKDKIEPHYNAVTVEEELPAAAAQCAPCVIIGAVAGRDSRAYRLLNRLRSDTQGQAVPLIIVRPEQSTTEEEASWMALAPQAVLSWPVSRAEFTCTLDTQLELAKLRQHQVERSGHSAGNAGSMDVQQLKNAEAAVQASEQRLRLFLEHASDYSLILLDSDGCVTEWLGGAECITGWTAQETVGRAPDFLMTPEDKAANRLQVELSEARDTGHSKDRRWHQKKDGSWFFADGVTTAFRDEAGTLCGYGKVFRDASTEKLAEEALHHSREQLQLILSSVAEGIYGISRDGTCVFCNPAATEILGYGPEEVIGNPFQQLLTCPERDPEQHELMEQHLHRAVESGVAVRVESGMCRHKDGRSIPLQYTINPMIDNNKITGAVVAFIDISHRKRTEAALMESEQRLRLVMDFVPQKVFTATADGHLAYCNPPWETYTGRPLAELLDRGWTSISHADDIEQVCEHWVSSIRAGTPFHMEHRIASASGAFRWHLTRAKPITNDAEDITLWIGSSTDIQAVKAAEADLAKQLAAQQRDTARLKELAGASRTLNSLVSVERIKTVLAEQARTLTTAHQAMAVVTMGDEGTEATNTVSLSDRDAGCQDYGGQLDAARVYVEVCRANQSLRLTQEQLEQHPAWQGRSEQGPCGMRGLLAVPLVGHGKRSLGFVQVSDKHDGEFSEEDEAVLSQLAAIAAVGIENASLYDSLKEQDQRKDEFLATLAHELRNPLAPLRTGLELLGMAGDAGRVDRVRGMMARQLTHMVRLVDDLMDISRVSRGKVELRRERVALQTIINMAVEGTEPVIAAARHKLTVHVADDALFVHGDPTRLAQVLNNLLNNAAKYTPEGGEIELITKREDDNVLVEVKDTGMGLSTQALPKVFDLFTQVEPGTDRSRGGLGIGLALVKKLVAMHGGSVKATSAGIGRGSAFSIKLPILEATESAVVAPSGGSPTAVAAFARRNILIVDDNVEAAETLGMLLEMSGHEIRIVHAGLEAITAIQQQQPELMLLDIGLPGMSGYEVAAAVRGDLHLDRLVIVALTGWGSEEDRRRAEEAGCDYHLTKPINSKDLAYVMERFFPSGQSGLQ